MLIVAAHPDDEVIGAGARLAFLPDPHFLHVTDGAPRDCRDARARGFSSCGEYARARRLELESALRLAGVSGPNLHELGFVDQEASWHLPALVDAVEEILGELRPALVLTHPYEGGHPDHDATCLAVHLAATRLKQRSGLAIELEEMTSYHNRNGTMATGVFISRPESPVTTFLLSPAQQELKRRLLDCFATQRGVLGAFDVQYERFRPAPRYDFSKPPHPGVLFYEMFDWGMTGELWRSLAKETLSPLVEQS